jgi:hypothetical protein
LDRQARSILIYAAAFIFLSAALYHWLEGWEWLYSIYFVIITFTIIGYGDWPDHPTNKDADHFRRIKRDRYPFTAY